MSKQPLQRHAIEYFDRGWTVFDGVIHPDLAEDIAHRLYTNRNNPKLTVRQEIDAGEDKAFGSPKHHTIFLLPALQEIAPELIGAYHALVPMIEEVIGRDVILSPYELSPLLAKVHTEGDYHGAHVDTNPVTVLLYLTGGAPTTVENLHGETENVMPFPGSLLLMQGRRCLHSVSAHDSTRHGVYRVTVPMNYYHPDDTWRPADDATAFALGKVER